MTWGCFFPLSGLVGGGALAWLSGLIKKVVQSSEKKRFAIGFWGCTVFVICAQHICYLQMALVVIDPPLATFFCACSVDVVCCCRWDYEKPVLHVHLGVRKEKERRLRSGKRKGSVQRVYTPGLISKAKHGRACYFQVKLFGDGGASCVCPAGQRRRPGLGSAKPFHG